jgi:hypothetical protein
MILNPYFWGKIRQKVMNISFIRRVYLIFALCYLRAAFILFVGNMAMTTLEI